MNNNIQGANKVIANLIEINTDNPAATSDEDKFQRYEYSKRVAQIISTTKHDKSLVVGVFGKWGEGKTSILNFIKRELADNCIILEFNPWIFRDERQLLSTFFFTLAGKLKKKLESSWKSIGKYLSDYSQILGAVTLVVGYNSEKQVKNLGDRLKENSLDDLKMKLGAILKQTEKKVVVFIDDIDRLTSKEIQSVFKLVKNAGDFSNIVYVLAFDDEIVAKSLAPEYGDNLDSNFGYKFLEKIIQIPLRIPKANPLLIKEYTYGLIDNTLNELDIKLSDVDAEEFQERFETAFLNEIDNPRFSLRYSINLGFVLPILNGEVHLIDLMLIEGIKVFKPKMYNFIRDNKQLFLANYSAYQAGSSSTIDYKAKSKERLETAFSSFSSITITNLIIKLFPNLRDIYPSTINFNQHNKQIDPNEEKRIFTSEYFEKYFQYTVPKGVIPDIYFDELIAKIETNGLSEYKTDVSQLFSKYKPNDVLFKLNVRANKFNSDLSKKIIQLLAINTNYFPGNNTFPAFGGLDRTAINLTKILLGNVNPNEQFLQ